MAYTGQVIKPLVKIGEPGDCWEWQGNINKKTGYGKKQFNGLTLLAHRWVWETLLGPIEDGMVINHKCSNKSCVNPHHLEVVSQAENCRHGKGTKLTADQAKEIKDATKDMQHGTRKLIAKHYGVSPQLISDIKHGRAWAEL